MSVPAVIVARLPVYTDEMMMEAVASIYDFMTENASHSITRACKRGGMPDRKTLRRWQNTYPAVQQLIEEAQANQAEALADEIIDIADERWSEDDANDRKLRIYAREVAAKRLHPVQGARTGVRVTVEVDYSTLTDAEIEARLAF